MKRQGVAESEDVQLYKGLVELSGTAVALLDREGQRIFVNDHAVRFTGWSLKQLLGGEVGDFLIPEDRERAWEVFRRCISTGEAEYGFVARREVDGEIKHHSANWAPVRGADGQIVGVQATMMDITDLIKAQEAVSLSEELYRTLIEASGGAVVRVNREGKRTFVSDYTAGFYGRSKEDMLGGRFADSVVPEEAGKAWELLRETFRTGNRVRGLVTQQVLRGRLRYISANWVPIKGRDGNIIEVQMTSTDVTEQVRLHEQLELYSVRIRRAQEEERLRVSRFLHDDTIQTLLAVCHGIQSLVMREETAERVRIELEQANKIMMDQVEVLRQLCMTLRPAILDRMGLDAAIRWFVRQACKPNKVGGTVTVGEGWRRLDPAVEVRLFRIVQEAVNNAVRHGRPSKVTVSLDISDGRLELLVEDDGQGFKPSESQIELLLEGHLGLAGMHERVRELGAELAIESRPGAGTRILVRGDVEKMEAAA